MIGSQSEPIEVLTREMNQILGDREPPAPTKLGVAPSALKPALAEEVSQARRDWPSYQPASEAVFTMPRATPSIVRKRRLAGPGIWETLKSSFQRDWKWWLGGSVALILVIAVVAGGGKKSD